MLLLKDVWENLYTGGIFSYLETAGIDVPWESSTELIDVLNRMYHARSSKKITSQNIDDILELFNEDILSENDKLNLASQLRIFIPNWEKELSILETQYNIPNDYGYEETYNETSTNDVTLSRTGTEGNSGSESITTTNTGTRTDNLLDSGTITNTGTVGNAGTNTYTKGTTSTENSSESSSNSHSVYGFNSATATPSDSDSGSSSLTNHTVVMSGNDQDSISMTRTDNLKETHNLTKANTRTDNLSESESHSKSNTLTRSLTDTTDQDEHKVGTKSIKGLSGRHYIQDILLKERELWVWNFFNDVVFPDVDKILTCGIFNFNC